MFSVSSYQANRNEEWESLFADTTTGNVLSLSGLLSARFTPVPSRHDGWGLQNSFPLLEEFMLGYKISFLMPSCRRKSWKSWVVPPGSSNFQWMLDWAWGISPLSSGTKSVILVKSVKPFWVSLLRVLNQLPCTDSTDWTLLKLLLLSSFPTCVGLDGNNWIFTWRWARRGFLKELLFFVSHIYPLWQNKSNMDTLCSVREFRVEKDLLTDVQSSLTAAGKALANKDIFPVSLWIFSFHL